MENFELHVISDPVDAEIAHTLGLLTVAPDEMYCEHCNEGVGRIRGQFQPFAVVLTDEDYEWLLCRTCYLPVTNPTED
jgi:hypothetical protein